MGSRLDGPKERQDDYNKRYDPEGGGKNPFRPKFPKVKKAKATQKTKVSKVHPKRKTKKA